MKIPIRVAILMLTDLPIVDASWCFPGGDDKFWIMSSEEIVHFESGVSTHVYSSGREIVLKSTARDFFVCGPWGYNAKSAGAPRNGSAPYDDVALKTGGPMLA